MIKESDERSERFEKIESIEIIDTIEDSKTVAPGEAMEQNDTKKEQKGRRGRCRK